MLGKKNSIVVVGLVGISMASVATYAAIPGHIAAASGLFALASADPALAQPKTADKPVLIAAGYGPEPISLAPIAFGEAGATLQPASAGYGRFPPVASDLNLAPSLVAASPESGVALVEASGESLGEEDCVVAGHGGRTPMPLEKLVALMKGGLGSGADVDEIRVRMQADLNRSEATGKVKIEAVQEVLASAAPNSLAHLALSQPFDLIDTGMVYRNGYDPCGNPAAIGGSGAFGVGPFANDFATINPVPVVASRFGATAEGG